MIPKTTCREWYEKTYKGIWSEAVLNDIKVVDSWRKFLMKDAVPSDYMDDAHLAEYREFTMRRMSGE